MNSDTIRHERFASDSPGSRCASAFGEQHPCTHPENAGQPSSSTKIHSGREALTAWQKSSMSALTNAPSYARSTMLWDELRVKLFARSHFSISSAPSVTNCFGRSDAWSGSFAKVKSCPKPLISGPNRRPAHAG